MQGVHVLPSQKGSQSLPSLNGASITTGTAGNKPGTLRSSLGSLSSGFGREGELEEWRKRAKDCSIKAPDSPGLSCLDIKDRQTARRKQALGKEIYLLCSSAIWDARRSPPMACICPGAGRSRCQAGQSGGGR